MGELVPTFVDGGESLGQGGFGGVGDSGTCGVCCLKEGGVVFAGFAEGVAEQPATFSGKFSVLKAFKIGGGGNGSAVERRVV